jgi:hypothetical protein
MSELLKRIRVWVFGPPPLTGQEEFVSMAVADEIEQIMPGRALTYTLRGRKFAIIEREEFELLVRKAGYELKDRS